MRRLARLSCVLAVVLSGACSAVAAPDEGDGDGEPSDTFGGNANGDAGLGAPAAKRCEPDPKNYDIPGNDCDDDGDGTVDNPPACDDDVSETGDAEAFARSLGVCTKASEKGYGLVSAKYTRGYQRTDEPQSAQHGILKKFGDVIRPREGSALGVLSTGFAREYNGPMGTPFGGYSTVTVGLLSFASPNGKDWYNLQPGQPGTGTAPPGFPKAASGCTQSDRVNDVISLKLELTAPRNASGIQFDFNFFSGEWPAFICSPFNDGFIAYLTAKGFNGGRPDNISFDANKNPVSVNNGFFDRCTASAPIGCAPQSKPGTSACPGGVDELAGTGFGMLGAWCSTFESKMQAKTTSGGATGWLTSQAPVQPGETFTLEFMIWDTGDAVLDSSVLLDKFTWLEGDAPPSTKRVVR